jgi:hypothetical protein
MREYNGYTYDETTGEIVYNKLTCWNCKGSKVYEYGISCPRWGKKVRINGMTTCQHCGAKNKDSHRLIGHEVKTCETCKGTGELLVNAYTSLRFSELVHGIRFMVVSGQTTFNESYLGMGMVGGCTDYGAYLDATCPGYRTSPGQKINIDEVVKYIRAKFTASKHDTTSQAGNFVSSDGHFMKYAILKLRPDGYSILGVGAEFSRISEAEFLAALDAKGVTLADVLR